MIIIYTDVNNAVINNNNGRLQDVIILFKISVGTCKDFFEHYRQFWARALKDFASPAFSNLSCSLSFHFLHVPPTLLASIIFSENQSLPTPIPI